MNADLFIDHLKRAYLFKHDGSGFETISTLHLVILALLAIIFSSGGVILLCLIVGAAAIFGKVKLQQFTYELRSVFATLLLCTIPFGLVWFFATILHVPGSFRLALFLFQIAVWLHIGYLAWKRIYGK